MMSTLVTVAIISSLEGMVGSNPKLERVFPEESYKPEKRDGLLAKSLPFGCSPGKFFEDKYDGDRVLVYIFEAKVQGVRSNLVSLGFTLGKTAIVDELKVVIGEMMKLLDAHNLQTIPFLTENLPKIQKALNRQIKTNFKDQDGKKIEFNLPGILKEYNLRLKKEDRKVRGGIF